VAGAEEGALSSACSQAGLPAPGLGARQGPVVPPEAALASTTAQGLDDG